MNLNEDSEFREVINSLKKLQQVKPPANFEADLMRRINSEKYPAKNNFLRNIFIPSRVVPAAALALTAVLLIFVLNNSGVTQENPFSTIPRERNDVPLTMRTNNIALKEKKTMSDEISSPQSNSGMQKDGFVKNEPLLNGGNQAGSEKPQDKGNIIAEKQVNDKYISVKFASARITDYPVNKAGLNFRPVNLSNDQKTELNLMKEKMDEMFRTRLK